MAPLPAFAASPFAIRPEPAWIVPIALEATQQPASDGVQNGRRYLLFDEQVRVSGREEDGYWHLAKQVTNEAGLEATSQIKIEFDPTYQTLVLHSAVVRRGGQILNRLDAAAIRLIQREPNLEAQVYDGRQSAVLFVEDLRVGDVLEYSYTLHGRDPTLQGRYVDAVPLGSSERIDRLHVRISTARSHRLRIAIHGPPDVRDSLSPHEDATGDLVDYTWDLHGVHAYPEERDAPPWYESVPWAQISEFTTWHEVAGWAARLFQPARPPSRALSDWIASARSESRSSDDLLLRAIRFVQDEVRYVAIEVGVGRWRPTDPGAVFERRFGDCKEKAALLIAILRAADIDAEPALVRTSGGRGIDEWAPSPAAFNHAIVRVAMRDGSVLWVDPTISLQGGRLDRLGYSRLERALVADVRSSAIEILTPPPTDDPTLRIRDEFRVGRAGTNDGTALDSERIYEAEVADFMRASFNRKTRDQLNKEYLDMYRQDFPSIHEAGPLEVADDRPNDVIRVVAHFAIAHFWKDPDKSALFRADLSLYQLDRLLARPAIDEGRSAPLGLPFPYHSRHSVQLRVPFELKLTPEVVEARSAGLRFQFESAYANRTVLYTYDLATLGEAVSAPQLAAHLAALDRARPTVTRALTYRAPLADGVQWPAAIGLAALTALLAWIATRVYRFQPVASAASAAGGVDHPELAGLRGWLVLLGIGVFLTPVRLLIGTVRAVRPVLSVAQWRTFMDSQLPTHAPMVMALISIEAAGNLALLAYSCVVLLSYLRRKRSFRLHFPCLAAGLFAFHLADVIATHELFPDHDFKQATTTLFQVFVWGALWISYLRTSRRARATFVD